MMDEGPQEIWPQLPVEPPRPPPPPPPAPEPYPFWGYVDLLLIAAMTLPCMALGILLVRGVVWLFHRHPALVVVELLPAQILGYLMVFGAIAVMFRAQYGKPFWRSLAWEPSDVPLAGIAFAGIATAIGVAIAASLLRTPETSNPMTDMMQDRTSLFLLTVFGITIAPVAKSWPFAVFCSLCWCAAWARSPELWAAAIPFGLLHYREYGNSWRHAVVISLAGAAFGVMRQRTGSTQCCRGDARLLTTHFCFWLCTAQGRICHIYGRDDSVEGRRGGDDRPDAAAARKRNT